LCPSVSLFFSAFSPLHEKVDSPPPTPCGAQLSDPFPRYLFSSFFLIEDEFFYYFFFDPPSFLNPPDGWGSLVREQSLCQPSGLEVSTPKPISAFCLIFPVFWLVKQLLKKKSMRHIAREFFSTQVQIPCLVITKFSGFFYGHPPLQEVQEYYPA